MRWFTGDWHGWGDTPLTDEERAAVRAVYQEHVSQMIGVIPESFRQLAAAGGDVSLHDANIRSVRWPDATTLVVEIAAWNYRRGDTARNVRVTLRYEGADLVSPTSEGLSGLAVNPDIEILYDEIDRAEAGRLEHRMLLWPLDTPEYAVIFTDAVVSVTEA